MGIGLARLPKSASASGLSLVTLSLCNGMNVLCEGTTVSYRALSLNNNDDNNDDWDDWDENDWELYPIIKMARNVRQRGVLIIDLAVVIEEAIMWQMVDPLSYFQ